MNVSLLCFLINSEVILSNPSDSARVILSAKSLIYSFPICITLIAYYLLVLARTAIMIRKSSSEKDILALFLIIVRKKHSSFLPLIVVVAVLVPLHSCEQNTSYSQVLSPKVSRISQNITTSRTPSL
jgi:hypothetical protein